MYYPRFTKVIIHYFLTQDKTVSWRNKIGMHTSKDDYLINTLRFVSVKEESQIYGAQLPKSMTNHEMRETKAYKTYLGYATGATPPKKARKFKKPASPQLSIVIYTFVIEIRPLISKKPFDLPMVKAGDEVSSEEPTKKSKRVKRSAKKPTKALAGGVVIRETPEMPLSKKKEKVDIVIGKGIELLSDAALTKEAQYEEVRRKSLRYFHKTHPSGSGTITKTAPRAAKIKPSVTNEGTGVKPGVPDVTREESSEKNDSDDKNTQSNNEKGSDSEHETNENESKSESDHQDNDEEDEDDEEEEEDELVKTPSNDSDDEAKITDKAKGDEDE
ncbi:hypothetical protein Tco_1152651 [Tanacetum coccineum]